MVFGAEQETLKDESGKVALLSPTQSPTTTAGFFFFEKEESDDVNRVGLSQHIHSAGAWRPRKVKARPMLPVSVSVDQDASRCKTLPPPWIG